MMQMTPKSAMVGVLLASLTGLAHAEGNYSGGFAFVLYAMVALGVMAAQMIYTFCLAGVSLGTRGFWILLLIVIDAVVIALMIEAPGNTIETLPPYILAIIPGFLAVYFFRSAAKTEGGTQAKEGE